MARRRSPLQPYADMNRRNAEQMRKVGQFMHRSSGSRWRGGSDRNVTYQIEVVSERPFWHRHLLGLLIVVATAFLAFLVATGQLVP